MSSGIIKKPWPYLAIITAHLIWGINVVVAKVTLEEFPTSTLAFLRFALACLLLSPFLLIQFRKVKIDPRDLPKLVAVGIFIIGFNIAFFFEGVKRTTAIDVSVLTLIIPLLTVLASWLFLKERLFYFNIIGVLIGFLGTLVILGLPQFLTGNYSTKMIVGNLLIILSSISFVTGVTLSQKMLTKYSSLIVTAVAFLSGTLVFSLPALVDYLENPYWIKQVTILGILGLIYMTVLSSISAYFLFEWGLSKTDIFMADLFQYIELIAATSLAVTFLGERISNSFIIGSILIVIGVFLGTLAKEAHHRHHKPHRT